MIRRFKESFGEKRLQSALKIHVRQKEFLNIEDVRTVGIVFDATNADDFEIVKNYVNKLKQMGKRVHGIGFYDAKVIPANIYYTKSDFDLFNAKEVKGMGEPESPYIKTFITEIRDILIDVNLSNKFPLRYISAMSYAKCKIGIDIPQNKNIHDMLISVNPSAGMDKYLSQVDFYLQMMNKKN
ncbi:MAG: hypothetical protein IPG89_20400 [Bacteroidetes bacterium]|nr:hypothetical protein [Bacteroidota bacterium]